MMRVYHFVFAAVVKSWVFLQNCIVVMKKRLRLLFSWRGCRRSTRG